MGLSPRVLCRAVVVTVAILQGCSSNDDTSSIPIASDDAADGLSEGGQDTGQTDDADAATDAGNDASDAGEAGADGAGDPGLIQAPVQRYDYAFDIGTAQGRSSLTLDVPPPGGDQFAVACRIPQVDDVQWNGAAASSQSLAQNVLTVKGPAVQGGDVLEIGASGQVPASTAFGLDVGYSTQKDLAGGTFTYMLSWIGGCDRFGPCDHRADALSEFHFEVAHPPGAVTLCPGVVTPGDTVTACDVEGTRAPTYSAFAWASDALWVRKPLLTAAGVNLVFYEVPGGQIASSLDTAAFTTFLGWITTLLGPMPYGQELRVAGAPTAWLGFEHPANIILYERLPAVTGAYYDATLHVLVHETVHQWAGNRVTLASAQDFVWKEATAEYLTYVFEDENRPPEEAAASLAYWDSISLQSKHHPRPTDDPAPAVQVFYGDAYGPGPMVLFVQLETMLGRPVVLQAIQSFLATPGVRSVEDLKAALAQASGKNLDAYFDAWVFGSGVPEWPSFSVEVTQTGGQATVTLTQKNQSTAIYPCAVEVQVQGATQSARALVDFGLAPSSATASATIPFSEPVTGWTLDPEHRVVGTDATGNRSALPVKPLRVWIL